jgi:hypothetical protein
MQVGMGIHGDIARKIFKITVGLSKNASNVMNENSDKLTLHVLILSNLADEITFDNITLAGISVNPKNVLVSFHI